MASFSERKPISEPGWKSCLQNFPLGFRQIVSEPAQLDQALFLIKHHVSGAPISVPWLPNAARVDKVLLTGFQDQLIEWQPDDRAVLNVGARGMGMTKKAEVRGLFGETGGVKM